MRVGDTVQVVTNLGKDSILETYQVTRVTPSGQVVLSDEIRYSAAGVAHGNPKMVRWDTRYLVGWTPSHQVRREDLVYRITMRMQRWEQWDLNRLQRLWEAVNQLQPYDP